MTIPRPYVEQSNFLKLIFDGGEVDFIVAPSLTADPYMIKTVLETETKIETPVEIVKKVFYRPEEFSLRDVFDFAFVLDQDPRAIRDNLDVLTAKSDVLSLRLERLQALGPFAAQARAALDPLPRGVSVSGISDGEGHGVP